MSYQFSSKSDATFLKIQTQFPDKRSLILPCLYFLQRDQGFVDSEGMQYIADRIGDPISLAHVYGVATFYTMYNKKQVGKFHIQICANISCYLSGSDSVTKAFCTELGIDKGQTTKDKFFTVEEVQCLGACGFGPVAQINDRYYENIKPQDVSGLIHALQTEGQ